MLRKWVLFFYAFHIEWCEGRTWSFTVSSVVQGQGVLDTQHMLMYMRCTMHNIYTVCILYIWRKEKKKGILEWTWKVDGQNCITWLICPFLFVVPSLTCTSIYCIILLDSRLYEKWYTLFLSNLWCTQCGCLLVS